MGKPAAVSADSSPPSSREDGLEQPGPSGAQSWGVVGRFVKLFSCRIDGVLREVPAKQVVLLAEEKFDIAV